ncbi:MAG: hypothetical protein H0A76_08530 [Candidatus Thiodubiliella endoseptemdiera]|uniref:Uncharacterized protein n=1 Tax=Candidatus Thiodubiliella endoseptemdiera TaxID=2738886 RepID=A0A853F8A0_9GAMM|nr:hypothetical protein [Candidatus Thiodubiliella endoseptemdiera]
MKVIIRGTAILQDYTYAATALGHSQFCYPSELADGNLQAVVTLSDGTNSALALAE